MTELKIPIQVNLSVCQFAQGLSALKNLGVPIISKSQAIEKAFEFFMANIGKNGTTFSESLALDYLSQQGLPVLAKNKRHKKIVDMFMCDSKGSQGIIVPFESNPNAIISEDEALKQQVLRNMQKCDKLYNDMHKDSCDPKLPISEDDRIRCKQAKGIEIFPNDITPEDLDNYNNYAKDCNAKGITPASISDFLSGNVKITM
jgi:hypothetical protein